MSARYRLVRIEADGTSTTGVETYSADDIPTVLVDAYNALDAYTDAGVEFTTEPPLGKPWAYAVPVRQGRRS